MAKLWIRSDRNSLSEVITPRGSCIQSFKPIPLAVKKHATVTLKRSIYAIWPMWPWKVGQIKNPYDMWCILARTRSTYHKDFIKNKSLISEISHFLCGCTSETLRNLTLVFGICSVYILINILREISAKSKHIWKINPLTVSAHREMYMNFTNTLQQ